VKSVARTFLSAPLLLYNFYRIQTEVTMRADRVELSWDAAKSNWLLRIEAGEEVIRRHFAVPKNADEQTLRAAARQTVEDEGYEPDLSQLVIRR
jgi:hypothetical protein